MDPAITPYVPHGLALLLGGLAASLGPAHWARTERGRAALGRVSSERWPPQVVAMILMPLIVAIAIVRALVSAPPATADDIGMVRMFVLGLAIGTPMSLPALITTRNAVLRHQAALDQWRAEPAEPEDRANFAEDLAEMIEEVAPGRPPVTAEAIGDEQRVLRLVGDLDSRNGEMLTAALREELEAVGFTRVEGTHGGREWWTRV